MNVKTKVSILLTLLTLSACQPKSSKSTDNVNSKPTPQNKKVTTPEGVEILLSKDSDGYLWEVEKKNFIDNLNRYKVKIRIPVAMAKDVGVYKVDLDQSIQNEVLLDDAAIVGANVEVVESYRIDSLAPKNIVYKVVNHERVLAEVKFEMLSDFIIMGTQNAAGAKLRSGSYRFANIVLGKKAIFETQGMNLNFVAKNMYAHDAHITTFTDVATPAEMGMPGKDGGNLQIEVERIEGDLTIQMQGQKGGQGYPGIDNSGVPKAKDGNPGSAGKARGGLAQDRTGHPVALPPGCIKAPTDGGPGDDGVPGGDGFNGSRGGNSGSIKLIYDRAQNFSSKLVIEGGAGGDGGIGGAGGMPGKGGPAGVTPIYKKFCKEAKPGPDGKEIQGNAGLKGDRGAEERSCISQKNETSFCQ